MARLAVQTMILAFLSYPVLAYPGSVAIPVIQDREFTPVLLQTQAPAGDAGAPQRTTLPDPATIVVPDPVPAESSQASPDALPGQRSPDAADALSRPGSMSSSSPSRDPDDSLGDPPPDITSQPGTMPNNAAPDTPGAATLGAAAAAVEPVRVLPLPPSMARLAVSGVLGRIVVAPDRKEIGRVVDVLVDGMGAPRAGVIDFGGFMGLGSRKIAVEWGAFTFPPGGSDAELTITLNAEEIKNTPEYVGAGKPVSVVGPGTPAPSHGP